MNAVDAVDAKKTYPFFLGDFFVMTAPVLLDELRTKGVHLAVEGEHVVVDAPRGALTDDLRQTIRQHKAALLAVLAAELLTQYYPCVVCGAQDRWNDRGIWRCRQCWPLSPMHRKDLPHCETAP